MFGQNLAGTRGMPVQHNQDRLVMDYVAVPKIILKWHRFVTLIEYVIFLNGAPFLITISRGVMFVNVKHMPNRMTKQLSIS